MGERKIIRDRVELFAEYLRREERSVGAIDKYLRDVRQFAAWLNGKPVAGITERRDVRPPSPDPGNTGKRRQIFIKKDKIRRKKRCIFVEIGVH